MKYVFTLFLIVSLISCTNKKAALVDRQKKLASDIDWNKSKIEYLEREILKTPQTSTSFDSLINVRVNVENELIHNQTVYDSIEWELKKY